MFKPADFLTGATDTGKLRSALLTFRTFLDAFFLLSQRIFHTFPHSISAFQKQLSLNQLIALIHMNSDNYFQKKNLLRVFHSVGVTRSSFNTGRCPHPKWS